MGTSRRPSGVLLPGTKIHAATLCFNEITVQRRRISGRAKRNPCDSS